MVLRKFGFERIFEFDVGHARRQVETLGEDVGQLAHDLDAAVADQPDILRVVGRHAVDQAGLLDQRVRGVFLEEGEAGARVPGLALERPFEAERRFGQQVRIGHGVDQAGRHDLVEFRHGRIAHRAPEVELRAPFRIDLPGDRSLWREVGGADCRLADGRVPRDVVAVEGGPGLAAGAEGHRPVGSDLPLVLHPKPPGLGLAGAQGGEEAGAGVRRGEPARQRVGRVVERVLVAVDAEAHLVRAADAVGTPDALGVRGPPVGAVQPRDWCRRSRSSGRVRRPTERAVGGR